MWCGFVCLRTRMGCTRTCRILALLGAEAVPREVAESLLPNAGVDELAIAQHEELVDEICAALSWLVLRPGLTDALVAEQRAFLLAGRQDLQSLASGSQSARTYGMSVTEPCMDWAATAEALELLAGAARKRRLGNSVKRPRVG